MPRASPAPTHSLQPHQRRERAPHRTKMSSTTAYRCLLLLVLLAASDALFIDLVPCTECNTAVGESCMNIKPPNFGICINRPAGAPCSFSSQVRRTIRGTGKDILLYLVCIMYVVYCMYPVFSF